MNQRLVKTLVAAFAVWVLAALPGSAVAVSTSYSTPSELAASDGAVGDYFGDSVAVSSDGSTALVGAYHKQIGSHTYQGAVYVFSRTGSTWAQVAELTAADGAASDHFGTSVALSADGSTALIGAPSKVVGSNAAQGAAYVFTRSGSTWTQAAELTASDGSYDDQLGWSVALSPDGATALLGAPTKTVVSYPYTNYVGGWAYVFTASGSSWTQAAELKPSDPVAGQYNDDFGWSVALAGNDTALIGAPYKAVGSNTAQGVAYMFSGAGSSWSQQAELTAGDGAANNQFGFSVSLASSGTTALIGAQGQGGGNQGAAYIFGGSGSSWAQQAELMASDRSLGDGFGDSAALSADGSTALIGADTKTVGSNPNQGAAYTFTGSGSSWTQQAELTAGNGASGDQFGWSTALSSNGSTALVGAPYKTVGSNAYQGAAFAFGEPDLTITSASGPSSVAAGATASLSWTVENAGSAAATGTWHDSVYVGATAGATTTLLASFSESTRSPLAAAATYTDTQSVTIPAGTAAGDYLTVVADADQAVGESSFTNNSYQVPTRVTGAPTVTGIVPDSGPAAGGTTVTISGSGLSGATAVTFGSTPAASFTIGSGSLITAVSPAGSGSVHVSVTAPGGTSATSPADVFTYTAPPVPTTPIVRPPAPAVPPLLPTAMFTVTPTTGDKRTSFAVDASASTDLEGGIASYAWSFGDGGTGSGLTASHVYAKPGSYPITLTVTDHHDLTATATEQVSVTNAPPQAVFTYRTHNRIVHFDARASNDPDGRIVAYHWRLGDGHTAYGPILAHRYTGRATHYEVTLTVVDDNGARTSLRRTIVVEPGRGDVTSGESIGVTDTVTVLPPVEITVADGATVGDTATVLPPVGVTVDDGATVGDTATVLPPVGVTVDDGATVGESAAVHPPVSLSAGEHRAHNQQPHVRRRR